MRAIGILVTLAVARVAAADSAAEATKLFEDAVALQAAGKYAEACAKFTRSFELDRFAARPAPGTQLNLGDCAERDNRVRRAYLLFEDAAREYEARGKAAEAKLAQDPASADARRDADRAAAGVKLARERAAALLPRLAKVIVRLAERPDGVAVRIGERAVPPAGEIVELADAGPVAIAVTAPGRAGFSTTATAEAGKEVVVEVPALAREQANRGRPGDAPTRGRRQQARVRLALGVGAGGAVALAASATLFVLARSQLADGKAACPNFTCTDDPAGRAGFDTIEAAGRKADLATYTSIAGVVLLGAATTLYVTAPREVRVTPAASASGGGVVLSGRF